MLSDTCIDPTDPYEPGAVYLPTVIIFPMYSKT